MPAIALVAAGARLGLSLGKIFGSHGFDVALIARSTERLSALTEQLAAEGIMAAGFPADVTDRSALAAAPAPEQLRPTPGSSTRQCCMPERGLEMA